jgi:hypothetical protein
MTADSRGLYSTPPRRQAQNYMIGLSRFDRTPSPTSRSPNYGFDSDRSAENEFFNGDGPVDFSVTWNPVDGPNERQILRENIVFSKGGSVSVENSMCAIMTVQSRDCWRQSHETGHEQTFHSNEMFSTARRISSKRVIGTHREVDSSLIKSQTMRSARLSHIAAAAATLAGDAAENDAQTGVDVYKVVLDASSRDSVSLTSFLDTQTNAETVPTSSVRCDTVYSS